MKRFALFFSLFLLCLVVKANPVTRSQALNEAKSFLATKGIELKSSQVAYRAPRKANAQENESSYYYIFNVGNAQGFVIVSGDDRTEEILGYSDTGSFDEENMPEPLKAWLEGYEREIESIVEVDASETSVSSPRKVLEKTKKTIAPLTTALYGSGYPYCTKLNRSAVGCTPVAVSILLSYYKSDLAKISSTYGSKIGWNNLLDKYYDLPSKNYTTAQLTAVQNLMYYTATGLGTSSVGGTPISNVIPGLKTYYSLYDNMCLINRTYYDVEDWDNIIYSELANNRPVLYNAYDSRYTVGHTLIVDGYDSSGLFHINWGWDGNYNGFFRLSVLARYDSGSDSSINTNNTFCMPNVHSAYLYVAPKTYGDINSSNKILSAQVTSATSTNVTCIYRNESGLSASYLYGVGYVKDDEVIFLKDYSSTASSLANGSQQTKTISLTPTDFSSKKLSEGTYKIVPMYKLNGENEWKTCQFNKEKFVVAEYLSNSVSLKLNLNNQLTVTNIDFVGSGLVNKEQRVQATVVNNSEETGFSGNVYLFASTSTTKGSSKASTIVNLGKNESVVVDFPFTPSSAGTYNIWVCSDASGTKVLGTSKKEIVSESASSLDIKNVSFEINKNYAGFVNNKRSIWGNTFDVTIKGIKNNSNYPIKTTLTVWLREFKSVSSTSWSSARWGETADNATFRNMEICVPANSEYSFPVVFENLKLNQRYDIRVEYNKQATGSNAKIIVVQPMVFLPAVTTWTADGESVSVEPTASVKIGSKVVAVDITDATVVNTITPNSNPNVLYYLGASQTVPSGLANMNVVKGDVADNITLVDGKDFFVPKRFTAKSINFTTTPTAGVSRGNNNNWRTIALPFEVSSVKNTTDNVDIDWFHSDSDTGKNFWIRKFDKLDTSDNTVIFENTDEMLAYEPYIMNVPDDYWGKKWDLRNKNITFYGENAILHNEATIGNNSSYYNFIGTTVGKTIEDGWFLNDAGDAFKYYNPSIKSSTTKADYTMSNTVAPFRAYFVLTKDYFETVGASKTSLRIKFDSDNDSTTGIMAPFSAEEKQVDVYTINGLKVASKSMQNGSIDLSDLPKGIYVINGKKFIQY